MIPAWAVIVMLAIYAIGFGVAFVLGVGAGIASERRKIEVEKPLAGELK